MSQSTEPQRIRLILDHDAKFLAEAIGLKKERARQINLELNDILKEARKSSQILQRVTETFTHDAELVYALFRAGQEEMKSTCPLHGGKGGAGILGLIVGGIRPSGPDDEDEEEDDEEN